MRRQGGADPRADPLVRAGPPGPAPAHTAQAFAEQARPAQGSAPQPGIITSGSESTPVSPSLMSIYAGRSFAQPRRSRRLGPAAAGLLSRDEKSAAAGYGLRGAAHRTGAPAARWPCRKVRKARAREVPSPRRSIAHAGSSQANAFSRRWIAGRARSDAAASSRLAGWFPSNHVPDLAMASWKRAVSAYSSVRLAM